MDDGAGLQFDRDRLVGAFHEESAEVVAVSQAGSCWSACSLRIAIQHAAGFARG